MTHTGGIKSLEKVAFTAAAQRILGRGMRGVGPALARGLSHVKSAPGKIMEPLSRAAQKTEQGISKGVGHILGPEGEALSNKLLKGTVGEMGRQAAVGAVAMPILGGGIDALMAPEGQRGEAFTSNLGRHALEGATWGGLSGAVGHPFRNLRRSAVSQAVQRRGLAPEAVDTAMNQGFGKNIKSMFTGKGVHPTAGANRSLAAMGAVGQVGQVGTEWVLPEMIMAEPEPPQYAKQAEEKTYTIPPSLVGAATGGLSTGLIVDALNSRNYMPSGTKGKVLNRLLPALGSVGGAYTAMQLAQPPRPAPDPIQKSLNDVDFDKLLRYYKKREDSPSLQP